jgi:hypothetical protein
METDKQDRAEELEALEAIFGDDFKLTSDDTFELALELPDGRRLAVCMTLSCHRLAYSSRVSRGMTQNGKSASWGRRAFL